MRFPQPKWVFLVSIATIGFVVGGSGSVVVGLLISPLMAEFGWSNAMASSIATAFSLAAILSASGVGVALDQFGVRPVMITGLLAVLTGLLLASMLHSRFGMLMAFVLAGAGSCAAFSVPSAVVVTNTMGPQTSLGMGVVSAAMSLGAASFSVLIGWWTEAYGWRTTLQLIASAVVLMLPIVVMSMRITRTTRLAPRKPLPSSENSTLMARSLMLSRAFIVSTASAALFTFGMASIYYHVVSVLIRAGLSTHLGSVIFGASWLLSALGSLVFGAIADRVGVKVILAATQLLCALGTVFLLGAGSGPIGISCIVSFTIFWGMSANSVFQFMPVILSQRFGGQYLGTLFGVLTAVAGVIGAAAPMVTGFIYDEFSDYRLAIYLSAIAMSFAFMLSCGISMPKPKTESDDARGVSATV